MVELESLHAGNSTVVSRQGTNQWWPHSAVAATCESRLGSGATGDHEEDGVANAQATSKPM